MKKPVGGYPGKTAVPSGELLRVERSRMPLLVAHLEDAKWDDGSRRETSTLMLLVEDGWLKACLNDRALGCSLWVTGDSLAAVLDALEGHLEAGDGEWRIRKPFGATGGGGAAGKKR
jgi:hypothetical protein